MISLINESNSKKDESEFEKWDNYERNFLSKWMSLLCGTKLCLKDLYLIGTHDSGAHFMNLNNPVDLINQPFDIHKWGWIPGIKNTITEWSIAQTKNFIEQCEQGIRVFDLRCSLSKDGKFWIYHGFGCFPLSDGLSHFEYFTRKYPKEILQLWLRIDCNLTDKNRKDLNDLFLSYKNIMNDFKKYSEKTTLSELWINNISWFVYINDNLSSENNLFGNLDDKVISPWINTSDPKTKIDGLIQQLINTSNRNERDSFYTFKWTVTPQLMTDILPSYFIHPMCCGLNGNYGLNGNCGKFQTLQDMSLAFHPKFCVFSQEYEKLLKDKVNVLMIDFIEENSYFIQWMLIMNNNIIN
jgi:hypothetical protein